MSRNNNGHYYRKGAYRAALDAEFIEKMAEANETAPPPVEASDVRDLAEKLCEKALRALEKDLNDPEPRVRTETARSIGMIAVNLLRQEKPQEQPLTPEERAARLAAAEATPEVRAYLTSRGWKEPEKQ